MLYGNFISGVGAVKLAESLETNSALTRLCLSANQIDGEGASKVVTALASDQYLQELDLMGNRIGNEGKLAGSLAPTSLALGSNGIGPRGATEVAAALASNSTLICLSFHYNTQVATNAWRTGRNQAGGGPCRQEAGPTVHRPTLESNRR